MAESSGGYKVSQPQSRAEEPIRVVQMYISEFNVNCMCELMCSTCFHVAMQVHSPDHHPGALFENC